MSKRILFLTHYFPPEVNAPANRTIEHCRIWAKNNRVTVITNFPNHPDGKLFPGYKNRFIQKENIDGIKVIRLLTFVTANEGFFLRSLNYVWYQFVVLLYSIFNRHQYDIVIATSPQFFCGLAGKYVSKIKKIPFILEIRDLWPDSIIAVGAVKNKWLIKILKRIERNLYNSAKKIIVVTKSFKSYLESIGIQSSKIKLIYNGIDFDIFKDEGIISDKELGSYISNSFVVGYIGTIGMAHSVITIVDSAALLSDTEIKFVLIGAGAEYKNIKEIIKRKSLNNIKVFPIQPHIEVPSIINKLNVLIVHLKISNLFNGVIPSKIFEGMAMKKPILIGVNGEARSLVEDSNSGIFFEPENSDELTKKILYCYNSKDHLKKLGLNGYEHVFRNFNRKKLAGDYLELIEEIT